MPTKLVTVDLGKPLPAVIENAEHYEYVQAIIMRYGIPVGQVLIDNRRLPVLADQLRSEIVRQLSGRLLDKADYRDTAEFAVAIGHAPQTRPVPPAFRDEPELADLLPALKPRGGQRFFLSVVVCTRDRPDDLRRCIRALVNLEGGRHRVEVVVVDNNPASGETEPVVRAFPQVRYEIELRKGEPYARNKGLLVARGDIVAYVDDDVRVPPGWPTRILAPFADERVMCVGGLVLPLELETRSQELYERYGGLGRGYRPHIYDERFFKGARHRSVPTWELGGTANVALRRSVIARTGGFDETLGAGVPGGVGTDIYMFYSILKFGYICYYEPAAYVWHKHREDLRSLERQLYDYSKGQVSYQLRTLVSDKDERAVWHLARVLPAWYVKRVYGVLRGRQRFPLDLIAHEIAGYLAGPSAFYFSNRLHRRLNGPHTNPIKRVLSADRRRVRRAVLPDDETPLE